jgi:hypothetical protein
MSRMDREVEIFLNFADDRDASEHRWWAEVEGRGNEVIYYTTWYATEAEAMADAEAWVKENGHVTMAF